VNNLEEFKKVSIRGRLAFAALCLENILIKETLFENFAIKSLVNQIWRFTTTSKLDVWHEKIEKILPEYILGIEYEKMSKFVDKPVYDELNRIYSSSPKYLLDIVEYTAWIGISNLYGSTGKYSETSLEYLIEVIKIAKNASISIPTIDKVSFSDFSKSNGWGDIVESKSVFSSIDNPLA